MRLVKEDNISEGKYYLEYKDCAVEGVKKLYIFEWRMYDGGYGYYGLSVYIKNVCEFMPEPNSRWTNLMEDSIVYELTEDEEIMRYIILEAI